MNRSVACALAISALVVGSTTASARLTEQKPLACPRPTDGLEQLERVRVMRDLWAHTSTMTSGTVGAEVPPHAAKMFLVSSR